MLRSRRCSPIRLRICACTVTSSAVVGSSANRILGPQASAMAIITRWRMPPDISCGYCRIRRRASGIRTSASSRSAVSTAPGSVHAEVHAQRLGDLVADAHQRVQRAHRVLEHHRHRSAPHLAHLLVVAVDQLDAVELDRAGTDHVAARDQAHDRPAEHGLARPRLTDDADRLAPLSPTATPRRRPARAPRRPEVRHQIDDLEHQTSVSAVDHRRNKAGS